MKPLLGYGTRTSMARADRPSPKREVTMPRDLWTEIDAAVAARGISRGLLPGREVALPPLINTGARPLPGMKKQEIPTMKNPSFRATQPLAGTYVAVYCAGLRGAKFCPSFPAEARDYHDGLLKLLALPRRLAKRRATRILHEHRMNMRRGASRGNMAAAMNTAMAMGSKSFTRYPGTLLARASLGSLFADAS